MQTMRLSTLAKSDKSPFRSSESLCITIRGLVDLVVQPVVLNQRHTLLVTWHDRNECHSWRRNTGDLLPSTLNLHSSHHFQEAAGSKGKATSFHIVEDEYTRHS
jgi:hypothetical protein